MSEKLPDHLTARAEVGGVGFQIVTEVLLLPHPEADAVEESEDTLRKDMAAAFNQVLLEKIPEMAEATGYAVETLQLGVSLVRMEAED